MGVKCCWCHEEITELIDGEDYSDGLGMHPECKAIADAQMKTGELT